MAPPLAVPLDRIGNRDLPPGYPAAVVTFGFVFGICIVLALVTFERRIGERAPRLTTPTREGAHWTPLRVLIIGAVITVNAMLLLGALTVRLLG